MKNLKLAKGMQTLLVTVFIIAIALIIVGKMSNNQTMASDLAPECPNCATSEYMKCTKNNKQEHTWTCENEGCDYSLQEEHVNGSHENQGHCQACGYQYQEHKMAEEAKYYTDQSDDMKTYHWKYYPCTCEDCTYQYNTTREVHSGGEQCESEGKCQYCDIAYIEHGRANEILRYVVANEIHIPVYGCIVDGCENIFLAEEEAEKHSLEYSGSIPNADGTTHSELYVCSVEGCGYEETSFAIPHVFSGKYVDSGDGYHSNVCTECNATVKELHTYKEGEYTDNGDGTHSSQCETCDYAITENHNLTPLVDNGDGTHTSQCENCNYSITENHDLSEYTDNGDGTHSRFCVDGCGYEVTEEHTEEIIPAEEPTCTTGGKTEGKYCTVCKKTLVEQETVSALGHNYVDGACTECGQEEPQEDVTETEIEITSEKYELDENYISKVQAGTTIEQFKANLETNATEINIYNNDELVTEEIKIGTGMTVELKIGEQIKTFTIIVRGDANGDGEADFKDLVKANQARLNRTTLEEIYSLASDVTNDGIVDFKDLVKINRFRLNKITEL